jgi:hypothetical protein
MILLECTGPARMKSSLLRGLFVVFAIVTLTVHCVGGSAIAASNGSVQEPGTRNASTPKSESPAVQSDPSSAISPNPAAGATNLSDSNLQAQRTTVPLLQGVNNSIQLGIEVNGQFSYPFVFTVDPQPTGEIHISSSGLITGFPSQVSLLLAMG